MSAFSLPSIPSCPRTHRSKDHSHSVWWCLPIKTVSAFPPALNSAAILLRLLPKEVACVSECQDSPVNHVLLKTGIPNFCLEYCAVGPCALTVQVFSELIKTPNPNLEPILKLSVYYTTQSLDSSRLDSSQFPLELSITVYGWVQTLLKVLGPHDVWRHVQQFGLRIWRLRDSRPVVQRHTSLSILVNSLMPFLAVPSATRVQNQMTYVLINEIKYIAYILHFDANDPAKRFSSGPKHFLIWSHFLG